MARAEAFPQPTPGIRPKGSNRSRTGREYRRDTPSKRINSNPLPEILYIRKTWVNDYITRKNKIHTPPPPFKTDHSDHSFIHPLFCSNFLNLKQPVFMVLF